MSKDQLNTHSFVFLATSLGLNFREPAPPRTAPTGGFGADDERLSNLPDGGAIGADGAGSTDLMGLSEGVATSVEGCGFSSEDSA